MSVTARVPQPARLRGSEHIHRIWDRTHGTWTAKIQPGEFCVTAGGESVTTVLGSCVSACIRDLRTGIGGMNHFMLPAGDAQCGLDERYGVFAMERLVNEVLKHGSGKRNLLEVKLVGGGQILGDSGGGIGDKNIAFARHFVETDNLRVAAEDLGGTQPRRVVYFPDTGRLRIKKLNELPRQTLEREQVYGSSLEAPASGDVELF